MGNHHSASAVIWMIPEKKQKIRLGVLVVVYQGKRSVMSIMRVILGDLVIFCLFDCCYLFA